MSSTVEVRMSGFMLSRDGSGVGKNSLGGRGAMLYAIRSLLVQWLADLPVADRMRFAIMN